MGEMGNGYGSECHLLRFLGRHRHELDEAVRMVTGAASIDWLDFPYDPSKTWHDGEWRGLDFLDRDAPARQEWERVWPRRGNSPNWDAVARISVDGTSEWLLVEAKAHTGELTSSCRAKEDGGRAKIRAALDATKAALGVPAEADWLDGYYQYANRLTVLRLLQEHGVPARLLFIYFLGDRFREECPSDEHGWRPALAQRAGHLQLPTGGPLLDRVHKLFLPISPARAGM